MEIWPWLLGIEDVFLICFISLFLMVKQRPQTIVAFIFIVLLLLTNVLMLIGFRNWFILAIPIIAVYAVAIFGRKFFQYHFVAIGPKAGGYIVIGGVVLLFFISLLLIFIARK